VLPARYQTRSLREPLIRRIQATERLRPGAEILDVGAGRNPTVPRELRTGCFYVGLDVAPDELAYGEYDEVVTADIRVPRPDLFRRFDLVVSCHTFEHVRPLEDALENIRSYLVPGGRLVALFSGTFSPQAFANRVIPEAVGRRLIGRAAESKFPAHYDRCWASALDRAFAAHWAEYRIEPLYVGANYFPQAFQRLYLAYEERILDRPNLASHYLVEAAA